MVSGGGDVIVLESIQGLVFISYAIYASTIARLYHFAYILNSPEASYAIFSDSVSTSSIEIIRIHFKIGQDCVRPSRSVVRIVVSWSCHSIAFCRTDFAGISMTGDLEHSTPIVSSSTDATHHFFIDILAFLRYRFHREVDP